MSNEPTPADSAHTITVSASPVGTRNSVEFIVASAGNNRSLDGSVWVPRKAPLKIGYSGGELTPPERFGVTLRRYKEGSVGQPVSQTAIPITVEKSTDGFSWTVRRVGNIPLDPYVVYFLELSGKSTDGTTRRIRKIFLTDRQ